MERPKIKAIAVGLALTAGVGLGGCEYNTDVKKSNNQEMAGALRNDCPPGSKPILYEVYTRAARPPQNIEELITGRTRMELTGLTVSCERDSGTPTK
jgi:hypothetical protein